MAVDNLESTAKKWAGEARKILEDPESVYNLAGRRLALISVISKEHFLKPENTFRVAVVGNPNLGKTTYSYSIAKILELYGTTCSYFDLDVYTQSGSAISGTIEWAKRLKREPPEIKPEDIKQNINTFGQKRPGIIIGDFPGRIEDKYQIRRLKKADLALILASDLTEKNKWAELCDKAGIGYRWVMSYPHINTNAPFYPQIYDLERKVNTTTSMIISATSLLMEVTDLTGFGPVNYQNFFTNPELIILEEALDFHFSIQNP